ncbi:MAG: very short patch repair endonuclease [Chloroflexi bacterium]|nr:very short patch repair endonuclease [Chloroflexota bacterium]
MDRVSRTVRSQVMASVKSSGTRLESALANALTRTRLPKFERNSPKVEGRPDFVFPKLRVAIFLDSCFWHGCRWHCRMPASNQAYWIAKIQRNRARDKRVSSSLKRQGWIVIRIWEHTLNRAGGIDAAILKIKHGLVRKQIGKAAAANQ